MKLFNILSWASKFSFLGDMKIRTRRLLSVSIFSITGISVILVIVGLLTAGLAEKNARVIAQGTAGAYRDIIKSMLEDPLYKARLISHFFETAVTKPKRNISGEDANDLLKSFVEKSEYGIAYYVRFEPNAFDGLDGTYENRTGYDNNGRFSIYWIKGKDGKGQSMPLPDYQTTGTDDPYQLPRKRLNEYYELPRKRLNECILEPHTNPVFGKNVLLTSLIVPIFDKNLRFLGVSGVDISLDRLQKTIQDFKVGHFKDASITLYSQDGTIIGSTYPDMVGKNITKISYDKELTNNILISENFFMKRRSTATGEMLFT